VSQRIPLTYFDENGAVVSNFLRCPGAKLLSPKTVVKNRQCAEGYGVSILSFCDKTHT